MNNTSVTIYHNEVTNHEDKWVRYNYPIAWMIGGKGSNTNRGYENANDVDVRIYYKDNSSLNINNFSIGDIIVEGNIDTNITKQQDLSSYLTYNITAIQDNKTGTNQIKHIHISGK